MELEIAIINKSNNPLPLHQTADSAGLDICAFLGQTIEIPPTERALIPTGLFISIPRGYEAQIRPRSGLALKHGITVLNSPGTIDSDYRGELQVLLANLSNKTFQINPGDRIAQMVVSKHERITWRSVEVLDETQRGQGGYGHTGK